MKALTRRERWRRRRLPPRLIEETDDTWLVDRKSRLPSIVDLGRIVEVESDDEYAAYDQLGPEAKKALTEDCVFKWSAVSLVGWLHQNDWDILVSDKEIANLIRRIDRDCR